MNEQSNPTSATSVPVVFDPFSPDFIADPFPTLHRLRQEDPVHRSTHGFWFLTGYGDVATVLRNQRTFGTYGQRDHLRAQLGDGAAFAYVSRRLTSLDPPDHTRLRALVSRAFTARRVEAMRPQIQALADTLLDKVAGADHMDVIAALTHPLPSLVICEMLGVPEADRAQFSTWTGDIAFLIAPVITPERLKAAEAAAAAFMDYVRALAKKRREALGEDLLSALIAAEESGDRLTEDELVATVVFLFSAGHQTTRDLVANGLLALLRHPQQWQRLVTTPALLPAAVEECLRYDPPVTMAPRRAFADVSVGGKTIMAGEPIFVSISGANRDPARFPDPDRFDIDRANNEPLSFGGGIHYCLGAGLARMEAQIILGALLRRYPQLTLAEEHPQWRSTLLFRGPVALQVAWGNKKG